MNERPTIQVWYLFLGLVSSLMLGLVVSCSKTEVLPTPEVTPKFPPIPVARQATIIQAARTSQSQERVVSTELAPPVLTSVWSTESLVTPTNVIPSGSIKLAWDHSPDVNVVSYAIYFNHTEDYQHQRASVPYTTNATINGLIEGIAYTFYCVAVDTNGIESAASNEVIGQVAIRIYLTYDRMAVSSFGVINKTNQIQMSINLLHWTNVMTFVGDGTLKVYHHTNNQYRAWFRTKSIE